MMLLLLYYRASYDGKMLGDVTVDQGGVYSLVLTRDPLTQEVKMLQHMLSIINGTPEERSIPM